VPLRPEFIFTSGFVNPSQTGFPFPDDTYQGLVSLSKNKGKHFLKGGFDIQNRRNLDDGFFTGNYNFTKDPTTDPQNAAGTGQEIAAYLLGLPNSVLRNTGDTTALMRWSLYHLYVQDDFKVSPKLTLNLGLRYEYFGPLHNGDKDLAVFVPGKGLVIQGAGIDSIFPPDRNNIGPRFGFAYQPWGNGSLVVRGGVGVFYDQINMNPFLDYRPGSHGADGLQDNPIGPFPVDNFNTNRQGEVSYNWDAIQQGGNSIFSPVTSCPTLSGCGTNAYNVFSVSQNFRAPYFYNYNLNVEKNLGSAAVMQVGYVGSQGRKLSVNRNINQNSAFKAQYPNVGSVLQLGSVGTSNYNSLQTLLKLKSWHGFTSQFAYTWAHALDEVTEYRGVLPLDSFNLHQEYGNGDFDTRNNFTTFWSYDIPGSSHGPKILTNGWQVSGLITVHSGQPFNWNAGTQRPGVNLVSDPFAGVSHKFSAANGGMPWVNPAAFCTPGSAGCPGTSDPNGNVSRNKFFGPGFADVDLSVFKNIPVTERFRLQLRAEMFNLFNRKNLASGAGSVGSTGYVGDTIGDFNGAPGLGPGEPFNMQLAIKILF
jgi:hypothetical protein